MKLFLIFAAALLLMGAAATPKIEIEGDLEVLAVDYPTRVEYLYSVKIKGQRHKLKMPASYKHGERNLLTGQKVKVRGKKSGSVTAPLLEVESLEVLGLVPTVPDATGAIGVLVMNVSFPSRDTGYTLDQVRDYFRTTIDPFRRLNSAGVSWYRGSKTPNEPGDFVDTPISFDGNSCDVFQITDQAQNKALQLGYPTNMFGAYNRFFYLFPTIPGCVWHGLATVGGQGGFALSNGQLTRRVISHELGHNDGLYHAHSESCNLYAGCGYAEYGDATDIMGNSDGPIINSFERERLNWWTVPTTTQPGDYTLQAVNQLGATALKLAIPGTQEFYNLVFISGLGIYAHRFSELGPGSSNLLGWVTWRADSRLDIGDMLDDTRGIYVTLVSQAASAVVRYQTNHPGLPAGYVFCSVKYQPCTPPGPATIASGAKYTWVFTSVNGTYNCDPIDVGGAAGKCFYKLDGGGGFPNAPTSLTVN
jgi:hypothetical protein